MRGALPTSGVLTTRCMAVGPGRDCLFPYGGWKYHPWIFWKHHSLRVTISRLNVLLICYIFKINFTRQNDITKQYSWPAILS